MATKKPVLILVPGIGDRSKAYEIFAWVWRRLGYEVHIIPFGWIGRTAPLASKMSAFLDEIDAFGDRQVDIIGISAGGTAAINALAESKTVHKVVALGTPFEELPDMENLLLASSIRQVRTTLSTLDAAQKQRILSVHGLYDQVVAIRMSKSEGIRTLRLWSLFHAPTIFIALTFCAFRLRRFLRKAM